MDDVTFVPGHRCRQRTAMRAFTPDPPLYIETLLAAARYFAVKTDAGELSPDGLREAFSEVWKWTTEQMRQHHEFLVVSLRQAEESDRQAWQTVGIVAVGPPS